MTQHFLGVTAYEAKANAVPEFVCGNFASNDPYEVRAYIDTCKEQVKLFKQHGHRPDGVIAWKNSMAKARKWLRDNFVKLTHANTP